MSSFALTLTLIAALLHAIWNVAAKRATGKAAFGFQSAFATAIIWMPIVAFDAYHSWSVSFAQWSSAAWLFVVASAAIHVVYFMCLLQGYRIAPMSIVYPVARGTGPLISFFIALITFSEPLTLHSLAGMMCILIGVSVLSKPKRIGTGAAAVHSKDIRSGVIWGTVTGLFIAAYTIVDAYAVKNLALQPLQYHYFMNLLMVPLYLAMVNEVKQSFSPTRSQLRAIFTLSILGPAGYLLILYAVQVAPVSHVAPAREVSMMFAAVLGGKLLREGDFIKRTAAAAIIVAGVWMLAT